MLAVNTDHRTTDDVASMGERIRAVREAKGWTQAAFAAALGVAVTTISRWEHGTSVPRHAALSALCRALDCSPDIVSLPAWHRRRAVLAAASARIARGLAEVTAALREPR